MDIEQLLQRVNPGTARAFVSAARHMIDALMIEGARLRQAQTPAPRDYNTQPPLSAEAPPGGWIADEEARDAAQRMAEAMAAEKWADGAVAAIKLLTAMGGL